MSRPIRIAISLVLLALLISIVDWDDGWHRLRGIPVWVTASAFVIFAAQFVISAWKWRVALLSLAASLPFRRLLRIYCFGAFFSTFLPSNVGGDVYRVFRTAGESSLPIATLAVIIERISGLFALIVIAIGGALWLLAESGRAPEVWLTAAMTLVLAGYFVVPLLFVHFFRFSESWRSRLPQRFLAVPDAFGTLRTHKRQLIQLLAISLVFQVVATAAIALLFAGVGVHWAFAESALANGAGSIAAILPISLNGIGVSEASFAGVASRLGIEFTAATVVSFLVRLLVLPLVILFGLIYMFESRPSSAAELVARESKFQ